MKIEKLIRGKNSEQNKKLTKAYDNIENLTEALVAKGIPEENSTVINADIKTINSFSGSEKDLIKHLIKTNAKVLAYIEKELHWVKKFHYQNKWMTFGMLAGVLFSAAFSNFVESTLWTSMGIGISMGLLFGILAGRNRDKSAEKDGLQLDL
ncbi:MAG: hypothetical protein R2750_07330 [Bacteroidales bacterium]